jgi:hypothetical protein
LGALVLGSLASILAAGAPIAVAAKVLASPRPGAWTKIGTTHMDSPAALWRGPDHRDWVVWASSLSTYESAILGANGGISKATATALHWSALATDPTLVANGKTPLLVFAGLGPGKAGLGCVVGAVPGTPWTPQKWSLSSHCNIGYGAAAAAKGVISAGFGGAGDVLYRIGVSSSIPAATPDNSFYPGLGDENYFNEVADSSGNGHFYLTFNRFFSKPASADGIYVKDLSANGPLTKAPGSGTNTPIFQAVAFANSTHKLGGIFAVYCSNDSACSHLLLWHFGAKKPLVVPDGAGAHFYAMASGPDGRLWLAWFDSADVLFTVRTNEADTKFGPVESYNASHQFFTSQSLGIGGGNFGRLDVVVCGADNSFKPVCEATQSLTALAVSPGKITIDNASSNKVTFTVTDAGDPVAGATLSVAGRSASTHASGKATITFPKGTSARTYTVTARATDYFSARGKVVVTS